MTYCGNEQRQTKARKEEAQKDKEVNGCRPLCKNAEKYSQQLV
jgi:hypothetical protein